MFTPSKWALAAVLWVFACVATAQGAGAFVDENVVEDLLREGKVLYEKRKLTEAQTRFAEVIKLDADNEAANHFLARIHALQGRFKPAIDFIRKLQSLGVSIYRSKDSKDTLNVVLTGILQTEDLTERGNLLIHFRETIRGLPVTIERRVDAHLMAIYAKTNEQRAHDIVKARYFANKPVSGETYFVAARAYLDYNVNLPLAASYFEQAIDTLKKRRPRATGNPQQDAYLLKLRDAEATIPEDFLAYTYHAANVTSPEKNRFVAAEVNPKVTFTDATQTAGLTDIPGPRIAVGDFDDDGFEDLSVCGRILKNNGGKSFTDVTRKAGVNPKGCLASLWLDYDNDGFLDLLCASFPNCRLWRNTGRGTFEDVTKEAGMLYAFPGSPEALAATDYDGDGYVDIFIGCFEHPRRPAGGQPDFLFHNTGKGRFVDVTQFAGLAGPKFCARGAAWGDMNNDGRPDLYVANYRLHPNQLWINKGDGRFADEAQALGVQGTKGLGRFAHAFGHSIGCAWGDIDNDGDLDLVVSNLSLIRFLSFADTTALYVNRGEAERWRFDDIVDSAGIRFEEMTADTSLCDFDNDSDLDLYFSAIYKERPTAMYQNVGDNKFQPATWRANAIAFNTWGQAWFDKDNDGDLDLALGSATGIRLFENQATGTSWLRVQLAGKTNNRLGIGSRVTVAAGALRLTREVTAGSGSSSQSSPIAHFGLGSHKGTVDVTVRWPNGSQQIIKGAAINTLMKVAEKAKK